MSEYVRAYEGSEPYVFVSYAHRNSEQVLPVIRRLYEGKYRIWYDEGINPGTEWPRNIAMHLERAAAVFVFVSRHFLDSKNCRNEVSHTPTDKKIYAINIGGEDIQILLACGKTAGVEASSMEKLRKAATYDLDDTLIDRLEQDLGGEYIGDGISGYQYAIDKKRHHNVWNILLGVAAALFIGFGVGLYGLYDGWFDDMLPARQPVIEAAAPTAQPLEGVSIDDTLIGSVLPVAFSSDEEKNAVYHKLGWTQDDELTYADLMGMEGLAELAIWGDEPIYELSFAAYLPDLEVITLHNAWVTDLTPLRECPNLKTVTVTADMLPMEIPADRAFAVEII